MTVHSAHAGAAASGGLAAAIAMAIAQIVFLGIGASPTYALAIGLSLASIGFGGTYAGVFFVARAKHGRVKSGGVESEDAPVGARG